METTFTVSSNKDWPHPGKLHDLLKEADFWDVNGYRGLTTHKQTRTILVESSQELSALESQGVQTYIDLFSEESFKVDSIREEKIKEVDLKTRSLIDQGVIYDNLVFSLSQVAQLRYSGLVAGASLLQPSDFPIKVNTKNDKNVKHLNSTTEIQNFAKEVISTIKTHIDSGTAIKDALRSATTLAELESIQDSRI